MALVQDLRSLKEMKKRIDAGQKKIIQTANFAIG